VNTQPNQLVNFEEAITKIEAHLKDLEKGDLPLDELLKKFEEAIKLIRKCQSELHDVEQKVKILTEKKGEPHLKAFESEQSFKDES
jgi:exodeoxyribonuclease VII small subunit